MKEKDIIVRIVPCEIYTRVSGYYRPINQFNKGKQEEFRQRKDLHVLVSTDFRQH